MNAIGAIYQQFLPAAEWERYAVIQAWSCESSSH